MIYRINTSFNLKKEKERDAALFLQQLSAVEKKSRNRFIVEAVIEKIERQKQNENDILLNDIREIVREELRGISISASPPADTPKINTELTEEEKAENDLNVLAALDMFG